MTTKEYTLLRNYNAPRVNLRAGEFMGYMPFKVGTKINGYLHQGNAQPNAPKLVITSDNMYALPLSVLQPKQEAGDVGGGTPGPGKNAQTLPEELQAKLEALKTNDVIGNVLRKSRAGANGLAVGGAIGLVVAMVYRKPILLSVIIGGAIGGYLAYNTNKLTIKREIAAKKQLEKPAA